MKRWLAHFAVGTSFLLGVAVCLLAVRGRSGSDRASWTYFRYLTDGSVRSNEVHVTSEHERVWLDIGSGEVGPYNGQLVWGYHVNADNSDGQPRFDFHHELYDGLTRWLMEKSDATRSSFPLSWSTTSRTNEANGDDASYIRLGISHWLLAVLLFAPPLWKLIRFRGEKRNANAT